MMVVYCLVTQVQIAKSSGVWEMSEKFELLVFSGLTMSWGVEQNENIHGETGMFAYLRAKHTFTY